LGPGHQEIIYSNALQREFQLRNIDCQSETVIPIPYKGANVGYVRSDITILESNDILELKAISNRPGHVQLQQLINYIKLSVNCFKGYLINFPQPSRAMSKDTRKIIDIISVTKKQ